MKIVEKLRAIKYRNFKESTSLCFPNYDSVGKNSRERLQMFNQLSTALFECLLHSCAKRQSIHVKSGGFLKVSMRYLAG